MKPERISAIMTKNVVCVSPNQKILDVKHIFEKRDFHHHIPVTENNKLIGMISLIDFMYRIEGAGLDDKNDVYNKLLVKDIMTTNPFFYNPNESIENVAVKLSKGRYRAIPIVDHDSIVGIVSTEDIIKYYLENKN